MDCVITGEVKQGCSVKFWIFLSVPGHSSTPKATDDDWSDKSDASYQGRIRVSGAKYNEVSNAVIQSEIFAATWLKYVVAVAAIQNLNFISYCIINWHANE